MPATLAPIPGPPLINYAHKTIKSVLTRTSRFPKSLRGSWARRSPSEPRPGPRHPRGRHVVHAEGAVGRLDPRISQVVHSGENLGVVRQRDTKGGVDDGRRGQRKLVQVVVELGAGALDAGREGDAP